MKIKGEIKRMPGRPKHSKYNKKITIPNKYMVYFWDYETKK